MDFEKFTLKSQQAIQNAQQQAINGGFGTIDTGHLLKGILEVDKEVTPYLLQKLNCNPQTIEQVVIRIIAGYPKVTGGQLNASQAFSKVLNEAITNLKAFEDQYISIELLVYSLVNSNDAIGKLLQDNGITQKNLKQAINDENDEVIKYLYCIVHKNIMEISKFVNMMPGSIAYRLEKLNIIQRKQLARGYIDYVESDLYVKDIEIRNKEREQKKKKCDCNIEYNFDISENNDNKKNRFDKY